MFRRNKELWLALAAVLLVTAAYALYVSANGLLPAASNLLGHGIGIIGFALMVATETAYTLRKRAKSARWGRVSSWLKFHIFTGLVGPYMVLLHPALKFRGVAAVLTVLTIVVVASGIVGRYVYTRAPRGMDDAEPAPVTISPYSGIPGDPYNGIPGHVRSLEPTRAQTASARQALAIWRAVHVPLTFVLFIVALVHIVGAVYYATLLK